MKIYKKILFLFSITSLSLFLGVGFVSALETEYPSVGGFSITQNSTFAEYARYFFNIGIGLSATVAVIVMVVGGIFWLISRGTGNFLDTGKELVKSGLLGFLLIISSYLIASTINPSLVNFGLKNLLPPQLKFLIVGESGNGLPIDYYQEIPVGNITENLISRTMNCYEFDGNGDPIGIALKTDDRGTILGPSLMNHDRIDCFSKIGKAIETKSKIIKELSAKIVELMEKCPCAGSVCTQTCKAKKVCETYAGACPLDNAMIGSEEVCENNCDNQPCECKGENCDPCPTGVKDKIENGPVVVENRCLDTEGCTFEKGEYRGLNEFRTKLSSISNLIEVKVKVNKKEIAVINLGNCTPCNFNDQKCLDKQKECLKQGPWKKLKLVEQLMYLKEKAEEIKKMLDKDKKQLEQAEDTMGKCYLAKSSVDFLQVVEGARKNLKTINVTRPFSDPQTQETISVSKYCGGYQYSNSDCFHSCQKICPGNTPADFENYGKCNNFNCDKSKNIADKQACEIKQKACMNDIVKNITCPGSEFKNFEQCINTCQTSCKDQCKIVHASCPDEIKTCENNCGSNSKCLIENSDKCVFNFKSLAACTDNSKCKAECGTDAACLTKCGNSIDEIFLKNCFENSLLCKNCSDQYAGYPECLTATYALKDEYSSSYVYKNPAYQLCKNPYAIYGSKCAEKTQTDKDKGAITCLDCYPETAKCPSASKCPECPCDMARADIQNPIQVDFDPEEECPKQDISSQSNFEYRVCSAQCNEFKYSNDPLTFYCKDSWWDDPIEKSGTPIGGEKICIKSNEIPIGRTVDDSENWATTILKEMEYFINKVDEEIKYIISIGTEKDYCKCDSKCQGGEPVCQTKCRFNQVQDNEGNWNCTCDKIPCDGNTCQKMINFLKGKVGDDPCTKDIENKGVKWYVFQIMDQLKIFNSSLIKNSRSDLVKELTYSREKTNNCSITQNNYTSETRMLSCQRAQDEILSYIVDKTEGVIATGIYTKSTCYGKYLGEKILKTAQPLMDNWFCCEKRETQ